MQSWHFTVVQDKQMLQYLIDTAKAQLCLSEIPLFKEFGEGDNNLIYGAPTLIIVSGKEDANAPLSDCSAATQNMLIAAHSLGIGSLWNGLINFAFEKEQARKKLNIPDGYETYFAIALGYAVDNVDLMEKEILRDGVIDYFR